MKDEYRLIRIYGNAPSGRYWFKEYMCYGIRNKDEICENCLIRFQCYTGRVVEIHGSNIEKDLMRLYGYEATKTITAADIAELIVPQIKVVPKGNSKVKIDFDNVRKYDE